MDPAIKSLWIQALKSGKYTQRTGLLKAEHAGGKLKHCCLGVLCEIAATVGVVKENSIPHSCEVETCDLVSTEYGYEGGDEDLAFGLPPVTVLDWSGLDIHRAQDLAEMNDEGADFATIADYIDKHL